MIFMVNLQVRERFKQANVYLYEAADAMSISEPTLVRWLRKELEDEKKMRVLEAIETVKAKKEAGV